MKVKLLTLSILVLMAASVPALYAQETKSSIDIKAGTANAKDPDKWGFNSAISANIGIDPHFALVLEPGFSWFSWDTGLGIYQTSGTLTSELKANIDGYMFPLMAFAKIMIPEAGEGFVPYIAPGVGYSILKYKFSTPSYTIGGITTPSEDLSETYKGFTWQIMVGCNIKPWSEGAVSLLVEAGYRNAKLKKGSFEVNMSGFVVNAGISAALN